MSVLVTGLGRSRNLQRALYAVRRTLCSGSYSRGASCAMTSSRVASSSQRRLAHTAHAARLRISACGGWWRSVGWPGGGGGTVGGVVVRVAVVGKVPGPVQSGERGHRAQEHHDHERTG